MYEQLRIQNFKCFEDFTIEPLDRVNLIAGKNNVGKTALLEAIWFHHGSPNPELGFRLNRFRGISEVSIVQPLLELFRNLEVDIKIELSSRSSGGKSHSDRIYLREPSRLPLPSKDELVEGRSSSVSAESIGKEIVIEYTDEFGESGQSVAFFTKAQVVFDRPPIAKRSTARFLMAKRGVGSEDVEGFGELEVKGLKNEIIKLLRLVEPRLRDLTVVVRAGNPTIWGNIGIGTLLPIQLMGDGLCRWLLLAQAIPRSPSGLVLIDEIENGLHHTAMVDIWRSIALLARKYDVQIFATTHSAECVRYAHQAFVEDEQYDFRLHRLEQVGETVKDVSYDKETLAVALESGLEFR